MNALEQYLLQDEEDVIQKTRRIRGEMVDELTRNGMPDSPRDVEVLSSLLDSMDKNAELTAKGRIVVSKQQSDNETSAAILQTLKMGSIEMLPTAERRVEVDISEYEYTDAELDQEEKREEEQTDGDL